MNEITNTSKQLSLISEDDLQAIIRPEENLEKWSDFLFPHPKTVGLSKPRHVEWEVSLKNGEQGIASIKVEPSTAHHGYTCKTYDIYLALIDIWQKKDKPLDPFNTSMSEICRTLDLPTNGKNIKTIEEELNRLLKTNISWTLAYKIDKELHTVKNQQILDTFDYSSMSERFDTSSKFDKTCVIRFHNKILSNLLINKTIPINFVARKSITSPIAKVLYSKVDKILFSTKRPYSRTATNLVSDLRLKQDRYKYKSQKKVLLDKLQSSLDGKTLSNMNILHIKVEETADKKDWKCVFKSIKNPKNESLIPKRYIKVVNTDKDIIDDLIYHITETVGCGNSNKKLYNLFAIHYSSDAIFRAIGEYKERAEQNNIKTKPAMFTNILHRIIHELNYEWIKDCTENGNKQCSLMSLNFKSP